VVLAGGSQAIVAIEPPATSGSFGLGPASSGPTNASLQRAGQWLDVHAPATIPETASGPVPAVEAG
jgi:hypothetical protein